MTFHKSSAVSHCSLFNSVFFTDKYSGIPQLPAAALGSGKRRNHVMWLFLGGLSVIAGLFVVLANVLGAAGVSIGLLLLGALVVVLLRKPGAAPTKLADRSPPPATADRQAGTASDRPIAPPAPPLTLPERSVPIDDGASVSPPVVPITIKPQHQAAQVRPREPRFELIPHKMSGINVRAILPDDNWRQLSRMVIQSNGGQCCECPNVQRTRMECHEVWEYTWEERAGRRNKVGVMRLVGLRPLCHLCHMGKHIKFATSRGELPQVRAHLMQLHAGLTEHRLAQLINEAAGSSRLKYKYEELDLTYLNDARFAWLHRQIGRQFGTNEMVHCEDAAAALPPRDTTGFEPMGESLQ